MNRLLCVLLILPFATGEVFFASRKGNHGRGGFCISNNTSQSVAPIYDLDSIRTGHLTNAWVSDWKISRFNTQFNKLPSWSFQHWNDLPQIVVKGNYSGVIEVPFDLDSAPTAGTLFFSILARSATILVTNLKRVAGHGYMLQLDHSNKLTGLNEFRVLRCSHVKVYYNDNCQEVYTKNVDFILQRGELWTHLKFEITSNASKNHFTISNKIAEPIIEWTDYTNDSYYHALKYVAIATLNPAIFKLHALPYLSPSISRGNVLYSLSRSIIFSRPSVLCISIVCNDTSMPMSTISMDVSTGTSGRTQRIENTCTKAGLQMQCKTGTLISGSYLVVIDIKSPNKITSIWNCADAYDVSVVEAKDGSWFKGCQTLPNMDSTAEQTINSSFQHLSSSPGRSVCEALDRLEAVSCSNLNFYTLPSKSIIPNYTEQAQTEYPMETSSLVFEFTNPDFLLAWILLIFGTFGHVLLLISSGILWLSISNNFAAIM